MRADYLRIKLYKLFHVIGVHTWIYSGKKITVVPEESYTITGMRYCWICKKRQQFYFSLLKGKKTGWFDIEKIL